MANFKDKKERPAPLLQILPATLKPVFPMNKLNQISLAGIRTQGCFVPIYLSFTTQAERTNRFFLWMLLFLGSICCQQAYGQQEPQYTNYMFNTLAFNPAYAGTKEYLSVRALHRDQWYNFGGGLSNASSDGRPITQAFSIHGNLLDKIGLGVNIVNDRIGARGATSLDIAYAYRIDFGKGKISLGIQAGIMNWRADWSQLSFKDPQSTDNAFAGENPNLWLPNVGAGVYYYNDQFYVGASIPRLASISLRSDSTRTDVRRWARVYQHLYLTVGGIMPVNGNIDFKPALIIKSVGLFGDFLQKGDQIRTVAAPTSFDVNASFLFYDKMWLGTSFRSAIAAFIKKNDTYSSVASVNAFMGYQFSEGMRIGFAYDYPLTPINNYTVGSFEIMLGWDFIKKIDKVAHPRYFF